MSTASLLVVASLLVFLACLAWFVWEQQRVDPPPAPAVPQVTVNIPPNPLDPALLNLFARFDCRLTGFERETAFRLNKINETAALIRLIREKIAFLDAYVDNLENPLEDRSRALVLWDDLKQSLIYHEGQLEGLHWGLNHLTI